MKEVHRGSNRHRKVSVTLLTLALVSFRHDIRPFDHHYNIMTMVSSATPSLQIRTDPALIECGGTRNSSRTCSWNATGQYLASGSSDKFARLFTVDHVSAAATVTASSSAAGGPTAAGTGRELQALTGHTGSIDRVRFHPTEASVLCTASSDRSARLWDIRSAGTSRSGGKIDVGAGIVSVEWNSAQRGSVRHLVVCDRDDTVRVYDGRKLSKPVSAFVFEDVVHETHFSPSGTHLVAGVKLKENGMGALRAWKWDDGNDAPKGKAGKVMIGNDNSDTFVGHAGPLYTLKFSNEGKRLATGGHDALVSLWDVASMTSQAVVARRTKFIRSVSFSHDSRLVATSSEEDGIDVADAVTGERLGLVRLMTDDKARIRERMGHAGVGGGADEIAFHPKAYVLACARGFSPGPPNGPAQTPQMSVARLAVG